MTDSTPKSAPENGPGPSRSQRFDDRMIEIRSQRYAEKTALGGMRVGSRAALFFFVGALAAAAFAVLYLHADRRVSAAVDDWLRAQQVSQALGQIEQSISDIRLADRRFTAEPSVANAQALQRSLNAIAKAVEDLGGTDNGLNADAKASDALVTVRDGFSQYANQFATQSRTRQEVGYTDDSGLRAERKAAGQDVRAKLKVLGLDLSVPDFDRLDDAKDTAATSAPGKAAYDSLAKRITAARTGEAALDQAKTEALNSLRRHQAISTEIAKRDASLADGLPAASDIIDYVGPSLRILSDYSAALSRRAPAVFEAERQRDRQVVAGGSAGILVLLVLVGLYLMRTVARPLDRLSDAAQRLAKGDRSVSIPARGNADQLGMIARSLDAWLDNLTEIDHLRAELDDVRLRLESETELRAVAEASALLRAPDVRTPTPKSGAPDAPGEAPEAPVTSPESHVSNRPAALESAAEPTLSVKRILQSVERDDDAQRGAASPIGTASQDLTRFSEFVNAATRDVERTESLMRQLSETGRQIADLEHCVETIRDEAHLLVFRSTSGVNDGGSAGEDDTLVYLSGETRRGGEQDGGGKRFDSIRESVDRAERLVVGVRRSLEHVTRLAQEIASDASSEALEATKKLLSQSEYLENMLDDLVHKMRPASGADETASGKPPRRERDY